jgi:hypothetical protein
MPVGLVHSTLVKGPTHCASMDAPTYKHVEAENDCGDYDNLHQGYNELVDHFPEFVADIWIASLIAAGWPGIHELNHGQGNKCFDWERGG